MQRDRNARKMKKTCSKRKLKYKQKGTKLLTPLSKLASTWSGYELIMKSFSASANGWKWIKAIGDWMIAWLEIMYYEWEKKWNINWNVWKGRVINEWMSERINEWINDRVNEG